MEIEIISRFDAVFDVNGTTYEMIANASTLELELEQGEVLNVFAYPISNRRLLPYVATIKNNHQEIEVLSAHTKVFSYKSEYRIEFEEFAVSGFELKKVFKEEFSEFKVMLLQGGISVFCVDDGKEIFTHEIERQIEKFEFGEASGNPYLKSFGEKAQPFCIFCAKKRIFYSFEALDLQIEDESVRVISDFNNHSRHGMETILSFSEEGILKKEELLYLEKDPRANSNLQVAPFAFLDAFEKRDFDLARFYLDENLSAKVSNEALEDYFGNFKKIEPYNFNADRGHFVCLKFDEGAKVFRFKVQGGKVFEIDLIKEMKSV